jgi:hypothetical protein
MSAISQVSKAFEFHIVSSIELKVYSVYITVCDCILYSVKDLYSVISVYSVYSVSLCVAVLDCIRQLNTADTVLYSGL